LGGRFDALAEVVATHPDLTADKKQVLGTRR